jgi:hypothetical protein
MAPLRHQTHILFDVTPAGQRFVMVSHDGASHDSPPGLVLVHNWFSDLSKNE